MARSKLVTLQEAASLLGVSRSTLRLWDNVGRLKAERHPANHYRMYRLADLRKLQSELGLFEPLRVGTPTLASSVPDAAGIRRMLRSLQRVLRDEEGNSSLIERFDDMTKVLYCKLYEDRHSRGDDTVPRAFSEDHPNPAKAIQALFAGLVAATPDLFPDKFSKLRLKDGTLRRIAAAMDGVDLSAVGDDIKGLAYEETVRETFDKGDNQQFFTPRPVVEFMVSMYADHLRGRVCDPACGTGGFLLHAARASAESVDRRRVSLVGLEIDERLAWVASINLAMNGAGRFDCRAMPGAGTLAHDAVKMVEPVDLILTNPPFGSDTTDQQSLRAMELGRDKASRRRGVLFIERCLDLLKPGGRAAIVIDDGVLNGPSNADVREHLLRRAGVEAVISLPESAFQPYASVKASILFLHKSAKPDSARPTFFGTAETVGRKPNGDSLLRLDRVSGEMKLDSDLPEILNGWKQKFQSQSGDSGQSDAYFWASLPDQDSAEFRSSGWRLDAAFHHPSRATAARSIERSRYPVLSLSAICDVREESEIPSQSLADVDINYIGLANMESRTGKCAPTRERGATLKSAVRRCVPGDVLFAKMRPELRKVCVLPGTVSEGYASSECIVLVPRDAGRNTKYVLPEYLAALLRSDFCYGQVVHLVSGIGRPRLSRADVMGIRVPCPPLKEQERLVGLFHRSESAANQMLAESDRLQERGRSMLVDAAEQLTSDLLHAVKVERPSRRILARA